MTATSETIARVEQSRLTELGNLDIDEVYEHIDFLLKELPGPLDLYQRWESQNWSAHELDFSVDKQHWAVFDEFLKDQLQQIFSAFFVGEQAVTDTLSPILIAAPDEESRWFLATQVVDEARHAYFFSRFFTEVIEAADTLSGAMDYARKWSNTKVYDEIFGRNGQLVACTEAVRLDPQNYTKWVQALTIYHVMVEGILALTGQRLVLRILRQLDLLPAFRAGFTAVTRDESRHVNYGVWALRQAAVKGESDAIVEMVERSFKPSLRLYANPERRIDIPEDMPADRRQDPRVNWEFALDSLTKRLRVIGIDEAYINTLPERGWKIIWSAVEEYEGIHRHEHPVRPWQRGEYAAVAAS